MIQTDSSTSTTPEESTTAKTYELSCVDCSFEATVEGDCYDVLDVAETHQEAHEGPVDGHFVNFTLDG